MHQIVTVPTLMYFRALSTMFLTAVYWSATRGEINEQRKKWLVESAGDPKALMPVHLNDPFYPERANVG